ncbi:hypothetical protein GCM10009678_53450 [Actinomadura kijaniata]
MGGLHRLERGGSPPLPAAVAAYRSTLRALVAELDAQETADRLTASFAHPWSGRAAATFNRHLNALHSAVAFWTDQGWLTADPTRRLGPARWRSRHQGAVRPAGAALPCRWDGQQVGQCGAMHADLTSSSAGGRPR